MLVLIINCKVIGMESECSQQAALTEPQNDPIIRLLYNKEEIQLPWSVVQKSKTLANCSNDIGIPENENTITIPIEGIENIPLTSIDQLKDVFDLANKKDVERCDITLFKLFDWLDFISVWEEEKKQSRYSNIFVNYLNVRMHLAKYLDYAGVDEEEQFILKIGEKLNLEIVTRNMLKCAQHNDGPQLSINDGSSFNTFWGAHRFLNTRARNALRGLHFEITQGSTKIPLKYYVGLFSRLHSVCINSKPTYNHGIPSFRSLLSYPLAESLADQMHNIKELKLAGVTLSNPVPLNKIVEMGKQLEKIDIDGVTDSESPIIETDSLKSYNFTLKELSLKSLRLTAVPAVVKNLRALKKLDLGKNVITTLGGTMFPKDLLQCDLSKNPIDKIEDDTALENCSLENISAIETDINTKILLLKIFSATKTDPF